MKRRAFALLDGLVLVLLIAGNAGLAWKTGWASVPDRLEVVSREGTIVLPLGPDRTIEAEGPLGVTVIEVGPGGARVRWSPCPNRLCVRAGEISRPGQVVACLPNRVALRILGTPSAEAPDAIAR